MKNAIIFALMLGLPAMVQAKQYGARGNLVQSKCFTDGGADYLSQAEEDALSSACATAEARCKNDGNSACTTDTTSAYITKSGITSYYSPQFYNCFQNELFAYAEAVCFATSKD